MEIPAPGVPTPIWPAPLQATASTSPRHVGVRLVASPATSGSDLTHPVAGACHGDGYLVDTHLDVAHLPLLDDCVRNCQQRRIRVGVRYSRRVNRVIVQDAP